MRACWKGVGDVYVHNEYWFWKSQDRWHVILDGVLWVGCTLLFVGRRLLEGVRARSPFQGHAVEVVVVCRRRRRRDLSGRAWKIIPGVNDLIGCLLEVVGMDVMKLLPCLSSVGPGTRLIWS